MTDTARPATDADTAQDDATGDAVEAHSGAHAVAVAAAHGVDTMFTLSGAHVFPMYDGAVKADPPMRLLDVRHEQTAVFAAEAHRQADPASRAGGADRRPRGHERRQPRSPRRTSAASPLVVLGGRAPDNRWGTGSLQELDHVRSWPR